MSERPDRRSPTTPQSPTTPPSPATPRPPPTPPSPLSATSAPTPRTSSPPPTPSEGWFGPTTWLGQVVHNPLQLLDAGYAKQWYARASAANWQAGGGWNRFEAIVQDAAGGHIATFFGSPQSAAQAWWSVGLTVPTFFVSGLLSLSSRGAEALATFSAGRSAFSALAAATDSLTGGQRLTPLDASLKALGLLGNAATKERVAQFLKFNPDGPVTAWDALRGVYDKSDAIAKVRQAISSISWGNRVIDAAERSARQSIQQSITKSASPQVGGILFENCAASLTDIAEILGAYWDAERGSLVLIGNSEGYGEPRPLDLPPMDADHLGVALRAALMGEPIGPSENERVMRGKVR
jgi:hypothetical protein